MSISKFARLTIRRQIKKYLGSDLDFNIDSTGVVDVLSAGLGFIPGNASNFNTLPIKFGNVFGHFDCEYCDCLSSIENMPTGVGGYFDCRHSKIKSLEGFNTKIQGWCYMNWDQIKTGGISLMLTGTSGFVYPSQPFMIIEKYLGRPEDIFECQAELIAAGFEEYTKL